MMRRGLFLPELPEGATVVYRNLFAPANERTALVRDQCEALWRDFHDLADPAFVDLLPFGFHQRWFEMYLGAAMRRAGLHIEAPKPGPDFMAIVDGRPVYIEAIAPTAGNRLHADAVPEPVYEDAQGRPVAARVPHDQITLRLADVFRRKADVIGRSASRQPRRICRSAGLRQRCICRRPWRAAPPHQQISPTPLYDSGPMPSDHERYEHRLGRKRKDLPAAGGRRTLGWPSPLVFEIRRDRGQR